MVTIRLDEEKELCVTREEEEMEAKNVQKVE